MKIGIRLIWIWLLIAVFQFADPDMVKGFRYKLYSTVLDKEQKEKEEKVAFPVFCGTNKKQQVDSLLDVFLPHKVSGERRGGEDLLQDLTPLDVRRLVKVLFSLELGTWLTFICQIKGRGWTERCRGFRKDLSHLRDLFLLWILCRCGRGGALLWEVDGRLRDQVWEWSSRWKAVAGVLLSKRSSPSLIAIIRFCCPWTVCTW